jgi:hypothetical protein
MRYRHLAADDNAGRSRFRGKTGRTAATSETMPTAGVRLGAHRRRSAATATGRTPRGRHRVVDGPFAETKEQLG